MRGAPQSGLARLIWPIRWRVSGAMVFRPELRAQLFHRQKSRKPARCQLPHRSHPQLSPPVRLYRPVASSPPRSALPCRSGPFGGLDGPTTPGSLPFHVAPEVPAARPRQHLRPALPTPRRGSGTGGSPDRSSLTLAVALCRTVDRLDPPRVFRPRYRAQSSSFAPLAQSLFRRLPPKSDPLGLGQRCPGTTTRAGSGGGQDRRAPPGGRSAPSLRTPGGLRTRFFALTERISRVRPAA
jgi:hypothetical protein